MRRRTLDLIVSAGGLALAVLMVVAALVLANRADFAQTYVREHLGEQSITFPAAADLGEREVAFTEERSGCVLTYAGQEVTTGKQAECYANEYLGGHLTWLATRLGMSQVADVDGLNYRELGAELGAIRADIAEADEADVAALEQRLADVTTVRQRMFEGTMLRNALLTSYGFSQFGDLAATGSTVSFAVAGILGLLALAGFAHAYRTPRTVAFAPPDALSSAPQVPAHV